MKKRLKEVFSIENLIQRFLAAWCCTNAIAILSSNEQFTNIKYAFDLDTINYIIWVITVFAALTVINFPINSIRTDSWAFAFAYGFLATVTLTINSDFWFCLSMIIITAIAINFLLKGDKLDIGKIKLGKRFTLTAASLCGIIVFAAIAVLGCLRVAVFASPNFDFGLFCNMFHHMKEEFLPITSSERDKLMSHFAVHISPIYYVLLPLYCIFPSPYTLQISQAAVLASGIIPLYLLAKHKGLSNKFIVLFSLAYSFNPVIICGTSYDLHENCFLIPLLLWLLYFLEKEKYIAMLLCSVPVFMIKEDAAVYVFFIALYLMLSKKKYLYGAILAFLSLGYFAFAVHLVSQSGAGVTMLHYQNYSYDDQGLIGMFKIILFNPTYVFTQLLSEEKLLYILKVLLPIGFLPFATKNVSRYILLLPFMLFNIMTSYVYQYSIDFQYTYGPYALMLYLSLINASELRPNPKRFLTSLATAASVMICLTTVFPKISSFAVRYEDSKETFEQIEESLEIIPDDATVTSSTFFFTRLYQRDEIYEVGTKHLTEYVVLDKRPQMVKEYEEKLPYYLSLSYEIIEDTDYLTVLTAPEI